MTGHTVTASDDQALDLRPRQRTDLVTRTLGADVLVLDRRGGQIHQLNATAGFVWARCDGSRTVADLVSEVAAAFDVATTQARTDVVTLLHRLAGEGLLDLSPGLR